MTALDRIKASKRKAKAQRDNWKRKAFGYRTMVEVFRGCIITQTMPAIGGPCHKLVIELLNNKPTPAPTGSEGERECVR